MSTFPRWFQQLRTYYASNSARMFVLHFNVDDYVIDASDANNPISRVVPFLERYARQTRTTDGKTFNAIYRYSHSLDIVPDDRMDDIFQRINEGTFVGQAINAVTSGMFGSTLQAPSARTSDTVSRDIYSQEERSVADLPDPKKVLRVLERLLRSPDPRCLVILEHVETLAPSQYADQDQQINSEILRRWATDYVFRSTDNLCILITRDLQSIDPGIYAPGTNCFPIRIDLPDEAERASFLHFMEAELDQERLMSAGGPLRMRSSLISGLARIDPALSEALERGSLATERSDQIRVLGKIAQGFRLVEIDQLNRQVRAEHELHAQHRVEPTPTHLSAIAPIPSTIPAPPHSMAQPPLMPPAPFGHGAPPFMVPHAPMNTTQGFGMAPPTMVQTPDAMIKLDAIKHHKRRAINEQSNGLLEIVDTQRGFDAIGGMESVKHYLRMLSSRILASTLDARMLHLIPRGLILAGPPGTGKTIIAEALALESNLNMVKLRNVREGLVGASERNLTRAFDVIRALSPILVFVDEIDQAFGGRGIGGSNDGGTSERMFGQILEFLGDDRNRGHVIWVAASNRPDVLDAAMLRRFDRIIPCLLPTPTEQAMILEAMPRTIQTLHYSPDLQEQIAARSPAIIGLLSNKQGLIPTGAVIETIARRAAEAAGDRARAGNGTPDVQLSDLTLAVEDYRSNTHATMYDYQSLLAVQSCNFYSVMPTLPDRAPFTDVIEQRDVILSPQDADGVTIPEYWRSHRISYAQLDQRIREHRQLLGLQRREEGGA